MRLKKLRSVFVKSNERIQTTNFEKYDEYVDIQYRCEPIEFINSRTNIASSIIYVINHLKRSMDLQPNFYKLQRKGVSLNPDMIDYYGISIVDIGARDGWTIEFLKDLGFKKSKGVELLPEYVDYAKKNGRDVIEGDVHSLPFEDRLFHLTFSRHTLEHTLDPIKALSELIRITKNDGYVFCSFPLQKETHGKHTSAIPNIDAVKHILRNTGYKYKEVYIGLSQNLPIVEEEGNEAVVFIQRN